MNLENRFEALVKRFDMLKAQVAKEQGQLDAYTEQLKKLEQRCSNLGIKPDELSTVISQKENDLNMVVERTEAKLEKLEQQRSEISANISANN